MNSTQVNYDTNSTHKACVIGAGSSGIACAKVLHKRGIPFDCFEMGSGIGGMWRYNNDSGTSSAYRSLHINTSRDTMAYSDFPMPKDCPPFPDHSLIMKYFEAYVDHFGFRDKLTFRHRVEKVEPVGDGTHLVTVVGPDGERRTNRYGAVLVANGHHIDPRYPNFPGEFTGRTVHSHYYRTSDGYEDQRVLVVGLGNSACDISCETARVAKTVAISTRRGAHIIPKYLFGFPMDTILPAFLWRYVPYWILGPFVGAILYLCRGRHSWYGLPNPKHRYLHEHPTISGDILNMLGHGYLRVKPDLRELAGKTVKFVDGTEEEFDVIVWCTGYHITFPFFDKSVMNAEENEVRLYKNVVHPDQPNLYFIGLVQPWGAIMPLAEQQSEWMADVLEGKTGLPDRQTMLHEIQADREKIARRYTHSARHTIQVDFYPYERLLKKLRRRGRSWPRRPLHQYFEAVREGPSCNELRSPVAPATTVPS